MIEKQSPEVTRSDPEPCGESLYVRVVERSGVDQSKRSQYGRRHTEPRRASWRRLGSATQARPESGGLCGSGVDMKRDVAELRGGGGAHGPAVDPGRTHANEELAVEAPVAAHERAVAACIVHGLDGVRTVGVIRVRAAFRIGGNEGGEAVRRHDRMYNREPRPSLAVFGRDPRGPSYRTLVERLRRRHGRRCDAGSGVRTPALGALRGLAREYL